MASQEKVRKKKGNPIKVVPAKPTPVKSIVIQDEDEARPINSNQDVPVEDTNDHEDGNEQRKKQTYLNVSTTSSGSTSTTASHAQRKNRIEPASDQGSSVSLRSKEAWSEIDPLDQAATHGSQPRPDAAERNETFAYVPYTYAKQCVARVVEDMKSMKNNHIKVVGEIDRAYRTIEDETQAHFDSFVITLQDHYNNKVKVFRQVVDVHRQELQEKQLYWDNTFESFSHRNKSLLNDKKKLLLQNKVEFDRLKNEKEVAVAAIMEELNQKEVEKKEMIKQYDEKVRSLEKEMEKMGGSPKENITVLHSEKVQALELVEDSGTQLSEVRKSPVQEVSVAAPIPIGANISTSADDENIRHQNEEIRKLQQEKKSLEKDLKKLLKQQMKQSQTTGAEVDHLKTLLDAVVAEVERAQTNVPDVKLFLESRLQEAESDLRDADLSKEGAKEKYEAWALSWTQKNGSEPTKIDLEENEQGQLLREDMERAGKHVVKLDIMIKSLTMLQSGEVPVQMKPNEVASSTAMMVKVSGGDDTKVEEENSNNTKLVEENESLRDIHQELLMKIEDLENQLEAAGQSASDVRDDVEEDQDSRELTLQLSLLQQQLDDYEKSLHDEKDAHNQTKMVLEALQQQLVDTKTELDDIQSENDAKRDGLTLRMQTDVDNLNKKFQEAQTRVQELEEAALANVPVDTAKEISALRTKITVLDNEKDGHLKDKVSLEASNKELQSKIKNLEKKGQNQQTSNVKFEKQLKEVKAEKEGEIKTLQTQFDKKVAERKKLEEKKIAALEKKITQLEVAAASGSGVGGKANAKQAGDGKDKEKLQASKAEISELKARIRQLELELKSAAKSGGTGNAEGERERKKQEKVLKELEKLFEAERKKNEKNETNLKKKDEEIASLSKQNKESEEELKKLKSEMSSLGVAAKEGIESAKKVKALEAETKKLKEENKVLTENFNAERVLRKKYYNMIEDMKGKIRVYCRVRPMSKSELDRGNHSVCKSPDEYSIHVQSDRGLKEFQFDQIFMPETSQEKVFEDTNNLVQSAIDGYNVCIFAYGQTGSGKTFTIIGDKAQNYPGVAPRAFQRIFDLIEENKSKFSFKVSVYMMELYNDRLLDLFSKNAAAAEEKMEIKKDKKGMVVIQGAEIKYARSAKDLYALFEEGSKIRHVASTNMNAESSRSHLVVGIVIESTNKGTGQVTKGKLSLVDLAGSERASKTGATAEQLKEAMSINKSLSALGDVISALSSDQSFIPYRNNKLTMLMQDSLGGNAKTLMFVNVSPADYNTDETVTSLTYASRVKLITNDASKNSESKEISRLKNLITKLKKGDNVEDDD